MKVREKENQLLFYRTIANNYSVVFAFLTVVFGLFNIVTIWAYDNWDKLPVFIKGSLISNLIFWLALTIQSKGVWRTKKPKFLKYRKSRLNYYMIVNLLGGYNIPFSIANVYFVGMASERIDVFESWFLYLLNLVINVIGISIFSLNYFVSKKTERTKTLKNLGLVIVLISTIIMFYQEYTFPNLSEMYKMLGTSAMCNFGVHLLIVRTFLYYSLLKESIKENGVLI